MSIDWPKFYNLLNRMSVQIPDMDSADPDRVATVMRLMAKVNNHRNTLDKTRRKINRMLGSIKNKIESETERLNIARAEIRLDQSNFKDCRNKDDRDAMVTLLTKSQTVKLAQLRGRKHDYEHAHNEIEQTVATLTTTKETLNAMRRTLEIEMEM